MRTVYRLVFSFLVSIISAPLSFWVFGEVAVYLELGATGAASRAELGDDFGLAVLGVFFVLPATLIVMAVSAMLAWLVSARFFRSKNG